MTASHPAPASIATHFFWLRKDDIDPPPRDWAQLLLLLPPPLLGLCLCS